MSEKIQARIESALSPVASAAGAAAALPEDW